MAEIQAIQRGDIEKKIAELQKAYRRAQGDYMSRIPMSEKIKPLARMNYLGAQIEVLESLLNGGGQKEATDANGSTG
jgi:hypothetical protein